MEARMARLRRIEIDGYRSVADEICLEFASTSPLVLVGENNVGKSNIVRAIELVLSDRWPGNHSPEDHEYFGRDGTGGAFRIAAAVDGVEHYRGRVDLMELRCSARDGTSFKARLDNGGEENMSNAVRDQLSCVVVGPDRNLKYQLSYASQWTLLSKLMRKFHANLVKDSDRAARLRQHFEQLHGIFHEVPEFTEFADRLASEVEQLATNMRYGLEIDFSAYDPSNYFRALRVQPKLGNERRAFEELGTGQEQILALGFAYAYAASFGAEGSGLVLVVEEPEAHLHPLAQEWLGAQMHRFVDAGVQIVLTTHSPAFIDLCRLDGLALARKDESPAGAGATYITQLTAHELARHCREHGAPSASPDGILEYYDWSATNEIKAGVFARAVVLVEGPTEALALPVLLRRLGLETSRHGISVIPVGGKGSLARWWRLFTAYDIPTFVLFDNDGNDDREGTKRKDILDTVGLDERARAELLGADSLVVRPDVAAFGSDYERTMRATSSDYEALEDQAAERVGSSKALKARWVAERTNLSSAPKLIQLATAIGKLAGVDVTALAADRP